jgi:hypothetical protein
LELRQSLKDWRWTQSHANLSPQPNFGLQGNLQGFSRFSDRRQASK